MTKPALILFAHGARDPRWAVPFERMRDLTQAQMPAVGVHLAFLELMNPRLPETVAVLVGEGCTEVTVVPVFLGQGGHVLRDLPLIVEELHAAHPQLGVTVAEAVGENAGVLDAMVRYCVSTVAA